MKKERDVLLWLVIAALIIFMPIACISNYYVNKARFPSAPDWTNWAK